MKTTPDDPAANDWPEWGRFDEWLVTTYPAAHAAMSRELFAGHTLVFHDIPYQGHNIWGATASMVMSFYRLLRGTDT